MANISINPIGWQSDTLFDRQTGIVSTADNYPVDLRNAETVTGITVSGTQPAQTSRYAAFKVNGQWGKLNTSGNFESFNTSTISIELLEEKGNTPAQLTALTNIPALAGKQFGVALGLVSENPDNAMPTMGMTFKCRNSTQQLNTSKYSPTYELGQNAQVLSIEAQKTAINGATLEVLAQGTTSDGTLTGWKPIGEWGGEKVKSLQLRADYRVPAIGNAEATLTSCKVLYTDGTAITSGMSEGAIVTKTEDWYMPIHHGRVTLKHNDLDGASLKVYVAFRDAPSNVKGEQLGVGSGTRKTFALAHRDKVAYDSFRLYFDGVQVFTNYELNCEAGRVTCEAPNGSIVSCDYEWGWGSEIWQEMRLSTRWDMGDYFKSEYRLSTTENTKTSAALKVVLGMTSGRITNEVLGTGTGSSRTYILSHIVKDGAVTLTADNSGIAAKNWRLHSDAKHITITAPAGQTIRASYDWISEPPAVTQLEAVFSE